MPRRIKPHHKRYPYLHPSRDTGGCAVTVLLVGAASLAGLAGLLERVLG